MQRPNPSGSEFPSWHPGALGLAEDAPGEGPHLPIAQTVGTPYGSPGASGTGTRGHLAARDDSRTPNGQQCGESNTSRGAYRAGERRRRRPEGHKKGFRKPQPNPHSPFAPVMGVSADAEESKKPYRKSRVQFSEGSSLAQAESSLIQGVGTGTARRAVKEPESEFTKAKNIVLNQLAASAKSRGQLEKKLASKEISPEVAEDVLNRFEAVKLIDDEEFAQMYVRTRANVRKLSKNAIRRELKQKGVDADLAESALEQRTEEDERADARELVRKKMRPSMDFSDRKEKEKIMRRLVGMLARKGYPSSMAFSVVREEIDSFVAEHGLDSSGCDDDYF